MQTLRIEPHLTIDLGCIGLGSTDPPLTLRIPAIDENIERLAEHVPLSWRPKQWCRLKTRVDTADDGTGVVRAKVWPRKSDEPAAWTIEVPVARAHKHGSPGLYGFTPMSQFRVYIDNVTVSSN